MSNKNNHNRDTEEIFLKNMQISHSIFKYITFSALFFLMSLPVIFAGIKIKETVNFYPLKPVVFIDNKEDFKQIEIKNISRLLQDIYLTTNEQSRISLTQSFQNEELANTVIDINKNIEIIDYEVFNVQYISGGLMTINKKKLVADRIYKACLKIITFDENGNSRYKTIFYDIELVLNRDKKIKNYKLIELQKVGLLHIKNFVESYIFSKMLTQHIEIITDEQDIIKDLLNNNKISIMNIFSCYDDFCVDIIAKNKNYRILLDTVSQNNISIDDVFLNK